MRSIKRLSAAVVSAALISTVTTVPSVSIFPAFAVAQPVVSMGTATVHGLEIPKYIDFGTVVASVAPSVTFEVTNVDKNLITLPAKTTQNGKTVTFDTVELKKGETAKGTVSVLAAEVLPTYGDYVTLTVGVDNVEEFPIFLAVEIRVVDDLSVALQKNVAVERDYGDDQAIQFVVAGGIRDENGDLKQLTWVVDGQKRDVEPAEIKKTNGIITVTYSENVEKSTTIELQALDMEGHTRSLEKKFVVNSAFEASVGEVDFGTHRVKEEIPSQKVTLTNTSDTTQKVEIRSDNDFFIFKLLGDAKVRSGDSVELEITPVAQVSGEHQAEVLASGLAIPVKLTVVDPVASSTQDDKSTVNGKGGDRSDFFKYLPWVLLVLVLLGVGAAAAPQLLPPPPAPPAP